MPTELIANLANSTLASGITSGATSLTVHAGDGAKFPAAATGVSQFRCVLIAAADVAAPLGKPVEFITVTNVATDTFTITRASESSGAHPAAAWPQGTVIANVETAGAITNLLSGYLPLAGGTLAGNLAMGGHDVTGVGTVAATTLTGDGSGITNLPTPPAPTLDDVLTAGATTPQVPTFSGGVDLSGGNLTNGGLGRFTSGASNPAPATALLVEGNCGGDGTHRMGIIVKAVGSGNNAGFGTISENATSFVSFISGPNGYPSSFMAFPAALQMLTGSTDVMGTSGTPTIQFSPTGIDLLTGGTLDMHGGTINGGSGAVFGDNGGGWTLSGTNVSFAGGTTIDNVGNINLGGNAIQGGSGATLQDDGSARWNAGSGIGFGAGAFFADDGNHGITVSLPDSISNPQFVHDGSFNLNNNQLLGGSGATLQNVSGNDWTVNGGIQSNPLNVSWPYGTARVAISSPSYAIAGEFPLLLAAPTDQYGNAPLMILMNTTGGDPGWAFQIQDSNDPINPNAFAFDHVGTASQYTFGVDAFKLGGFGIYLNDGLGSGGTFFKLDSGTISDAGVTCYSAGTFYGAFSGDSTSVTHELSAGTNPTIAAGVGAGTSPTVSISGKDTAGSVTVTTGTLPTGTNAVIATITFGTAYSAAPFPILCPANAATATLSGVSMVFVTATTTTFVITSGTTALTAATQYKWNYLVHG